jgi:hypothetical protein
MHSSTKFLLAATMFLAPTFTCAQLLQAKDQTNQLARLSLSSTSPIAAGEKGFPQVCFSVDRDGRYQMSRLTSEGGRELLQGTVLPGKLKKLEELLGDSEFISVGSSGGLLRNSAQAFAAEVPREKGTLRIFISDTDTENPFPRSVRRVANWLQNFNPEDAEPFETSVPDICPRGEGFEPLALGMPGGAVLGSR